MDEDDYKISNLAKEIDLAEADIREIKKNLSALELKFALLAAQTVYIENRVLNIDSGFTWLWRTVVGIIIAGLIAFIISGGLATKTLIGQ